MGKRVDFVNNSSVITEDWLDDLQELLSRHIDGIGLERVDASTVRAKIDAQGSVVTDASSGANKWRYVTVPPTVTVSGSAGTRYIYAVGGADSNALNPATNSNKTFTLEASTSTPAGTNTRLLGTCTWSGSAVSNIRFTAGQQPPADLTNAIEITPNDAGGVPLTLRGYSGHTANLFQIGTSASATDRAVIDVNGRLALPVTGSNGGITIGGDVSVYRSSAGVATITGLTVTNNFTTTGSTVSIGSSGTTLGFFGSAGSARATGYTLTNVTTDRTYNANATTIDELADVLGTLITDLKNLGLVA